MFSGNQTLGQTPEPKPKSTGFLDSLFNIASKGYGMIISTEQQRRESDIEREKIRAQVAIVKLQAQVSRPATGPRIMGMRMPAGGADWTMPILIGIGVLGIGAFAMTRK